MSQYHNPYRNPYPGQGTARYSNSYGEPSASQDAGPAKAPSQNGAQSSARNQAQDQPQNQAQNQNQNSGQDVPPESGRGKAGWQNDPSLKNMDLKKLAFLSELVAESGSKPLDALLPFLVTANQNANSMGLQFNDAETSLLLEVLKKHMSPEEQSRIDMLRKMADILGKK